MNRKSLLLSILLGGLAGCHSAEGGFTTFVSKEGDVRLQRPMAVTPSTDFNGRALLQSGWRVVWDGRDVGQGQGIVRLTLPARAADGSAVSEVLQIGSSRAEDVVATCLTYGLASGSGMHLPTTAIKDHDWTTYTSGDAGMSQAIKAVNYRLVHDGVCYAMDRISYAVRAAKADENAQTDTAAARIMDGVLSSVEIMTVVRR